jgi:outer membrane protein TolC
MKKYVAILVVCILLLPLCAFAQVLGSVTTTQLPVPGTTTSITTLNPAVIVQGSFSGSSSSTDTQPFSGRLTFSDALARGLSANLGSIDAGVAARAADADARIVRSALLPHLDVDYTQARRDTNLAALGIGINGPLPGVAFPTLVGPFNVVDVRGYISQSIVDLAGWHAFRAARETAHESDLIAQDARDQVTLAVGAAYLQVVASQARLTSARAQLDTAEALYNQTSAEQRVGVAAQIDVNRAQVDVLTQRQRLVSLQTDLARQKINLARLTGLPPTDQYEIAGDVPYAAPPPMAMEAAIAEALAARADVKAADAAVRAAEQRRTAASAERLPSVFVNADYGAIGNSFSDARGTFLVAGTVRVPLWEGGRVEGQVQLTAAVLRQRRAERENIRAQVVADVRNAWLEVQAATSQVELARTNASTLRETLGLTRQRFNAGITDSLDVVRAQEALATADLDTINAVFAHNLAKLALARALGVSSDGLQRFVVVR